MYSFLTIISLQGSRTVLRGDQPAQSISIHSHYHSYVAGICLQESAPIIARLPTEMVTLRAWKKNGNGDGSVSEASMCGKQLSTFPSMEPEGFFF